MKNNLPKVDNPSDPVAWCREAAALLEIEDYKGAGYCYQESLKLRPGVPDVWYNLACIYEKLGGRDVALTTLLSSSKKFPNDYRFPAECSRLLAESGKYSEAVESVSEAIKINPHSQVLLSNKAGYLLLLNENEKALEFADSALAIEPSYTAALLHKAHALAKLQRMNEALETLQSAPQDDARVLKTIANLSLRTGDMERGLSSSEKLIALTPEDDQAWSLLGSARAYSGDKDGAIEAFTKATKLNPKEKSYKENLREVKKSA